MFLIIHAPSMSIGLKSYSGILIPLFLRFSFTIVSWTAHATFVQFSKPLPFTAVITSGKSSSFSMYCLPSSSLNLLWKASKILSCSIIINFFVGIGDILEFYLLLSFRWDNLFVFDPKLGWSCLDSIKTIMSFWIWSTFSIKNFSNFWFWL